MSEIDQAADLLRNGRLVAFPTETVYGLGANALDPEAVQRIFHVKGRPLSSPLIVHIASIEAARELALDWTDNAEALAQKFWPGPLTLVLPKQPCIPDLVTASLPSVGLRMPAHPMALALLKATGLPLAAPSANRFTEVSPTTAQHVRETLGSAVDMILDGGSCTVGIESTVLSLTGSAPRILRFGMISQPAIEAVIGPVLTGGGAESPGQHPKHYSPRTTIILGDPPLQGRGISPEMPHDPVTYAERLYRVLHGLDGENYDWIALALPPDTPEWAGIRDRLQRAAHSS